MIERPQDSDKQIYRSTIEWRATGTPVSDWNSVPRCVPDCALINKGGRHSRPPPLCSVCVSQTSGNFVLSRRAGKNEGEEGIDVVVRVTRCSTSFFFFFRFDILRRTCKEGGVENCQGDGICLFLFCFLFPWKIIIFSFLSVFYFR